MRKSSLAITVFGVAALLGAVATISLDKRNADAARQVPVRLADVPLVSDAGPTTLAANNGAWTVLLFGYLTCPDVCPTALAYLAREMEQLGPRAAGARVAFVSVDPERDGPVALGKYVRHFNKNFVGLTSDDAGLKALTTPLGAFYGYEKADDSAANYLVTHSSSFFLLDPQGRFVKALSAPHERGVVAQELNRLIGNGAH